jgi:hypothetical protein
MKKVLLGVAIVAALLFAAAAGAVAARKVFKVGVGDVVYIKRSNVSCSVANPWKQMVCYKRDATGHAVPGSYGATTSDKFAAVVRFDKNGNPKVVLKKDNR